ncbi:hypothetical protein DMC30DRAFT_450021, partial [Rhodotorula diobovata]
CQIRCSHPASCPSSSSALPRLAPPNPPPRPSLPCRPRTSSARSWRSTLVTVILLSRLSLSRRRLARRTSPSCRRPSLPTPVKTSSTRSCASTPSTATRASRPCLCAEDHDDTSQSASPTHRRQTHRTDPSPHPRGGERHPAPPTLPRTSTCCAQCLQGQIHELGIPSADTAACAASSPCNEIVPWRAPHARSHRSLA